MTAALNGPTRMSRATKLGIGLTVGIAVVLVIAGLLARAGGPAAEPLRLASMAESAQAMQQAGATMQAHAQAMLDEGRRTGDQDLIAHGEHWQRDGQALAQGGQWMAMNPTAPGSLATAPAELAAQGSWGELARTVQAMQHDPSRARATDLEALRWAGLAMWAEGQTMTEHGRVMAEEADLMTTRHGLGGPAADDLRGDAQTMREVSAALAGNGQAMIYYAGQMQRSLGAR